VKKLLILATVLALLAVLAVPMAAFADGSTQVNGDVTETTVTVTAPGACNFSPFTEGLNGPAAGSSQGNVTFTQGTAEYDHWALKVYSKNDGTWDFSSGRMWSIGLGRQLDNNMWINLTNDYSTSVNPGTGIVYNGDSSASYLYWIYAWQNITHPDATAGAGNYFIIIYSEVSLVL